MEKNDFNTIRSYILKTAGIELGEDKLYLVESRLQPLAKEMGLGSMTDLVRIVRDSPGSQQAYQVLDAMTTNESLFFRDITPFKAISDVVLPQLVERNAKSKSIRIWCAACSTGQEPYSLAMTIADFPKNLADWNMHITATDISLTAIERARQGRYSAFEVKRGLPEPQLRKYFTETDGVFEINAAMKKYISWKQVNILEPFQNLGRFDFILCRNILIYFNPETKRKIIDNLADRLNPNGYFMLGAAETILGLSERFKKVPGVNTSLYGRVD